MKRLNFNIKDRKVLITSLCLIIVCMFTLTVAYSALNVVLTINGNARVSAANWDIYLDNPKVEPGSATKNVPEIKTSSRLEFETTLNMPGDYYEFTVDVVNGGDIDAMIENVILTPELSEEQSRFLEYNVSYQNGRSIRTNQLLEKDTRMPIVVRIDYKKDLYASDLPTGQVVLDFTLTLEYIQSDGSGSNVYNNGEFTVQTGSLRFGNIVSIGTEEFYIIGVDDENVKLFSKYNLYVGGDMNNEGGTWDEQWILYGDEATGMQDSRMLGMQENENIYHGIAYHNLDAAFPLVYSGSLIEGYVNNYKNILESYYNVDIVEARLITKEELKDTSTFNCPFDDLCSTRYPWIYSTSYWTMSVSDFGEPDVAVMLSWGRLTDTYDYYNCFGVRPVIVVPRDSFEMIPS